LVSCVSAASIAWSSKWKTQKLIERREFDDLPKCQMEDYRSQIFPEAEPDHRRRVILVQHSLGKQQVRTIGFSDRIQRFSIVRDSHLIANPLQRRTLYLVSP
jgi:predicted alpha/beta hydrolase family esterase